MFHFSSQLLAILKWLLHIQYTQSDKPEWKWNWHFSNSFQIVRILFIIKCNWNFEGKKGQQLSSPYKFINKSIVCLLCIQFPYTWDSIHFHFDPFPTTKQKLNHRRITTFDVILHFSWKYNYFIITSANNQHHRTFRCMAWFNGVKYQFKLVFFCFCALFHRAHNSFGPRISPSSNIVRITKMNEKKKLKSWSI